MWQPCGQRSCMSAGSKRWALAFFCSVQICYMFWESKFRGQSHWHLGLRTPSVLAKRMPLRGGDFRLKNVFGRKICQNLPMRSGIFLQVQKLCTDLNLTLLYILVLGTYGKFTRKNIFLALCVCFPQLWSSAGRRFAASKSSLMMMMIAFITIKSGLVPLI